MSLTPEQFRYGFGSAISEEESVALFERWTIPSPGAPLVEAAGANFSPYFPGKGRHRQRGQGPLLLMVGGKDHTATEVSAKSTLKQYSGSAAVTEFEEFPDRGPSLTIDHRLAQDRRHVLGMAGQADLLAPVTFPER